MKRDERDRESAILYESRRDSDVDVIYSIEGQLHGRLGIGRLIIAAESPRSVQLQVEVARFDISVSRNLGSGAMLRKNGIYHCFSAICLKQRNAMKAG